jgi:hypothetical protein
MRGSPKESRPWVRVDEGIPEGPGVLRASRSNRERATRCACYFAAWQDSEGDGDFMTVRTGR